MTGVVPAAEIGGDDPEETELLKQLHARAERFLRSFAWCRSVCAGYFGGGVGRVVGLSLFLIDPVGHTDRWLWVVVGDLPSAYLVIDEPKSPRTALEVYCRQMSDWIAAVLAGAGLEGVYPVAAPPEREYAEMLRTRVEFLRRRIGPWLEQPA
ncbi:MAG TPA: hypothetical protein VK454_14105 [Myxococcaceae bacterium]|nr:hypothetical protein [Myxococcaceae bacterium]